MTTIIYVPQLIESAEQAAALPEGTIIIQEDKDGPWEKWADGYFRGASKTVVGPEYVLERFALVPIEVEEEVVVNTADLGLDPETVYQHDDPDLIAAVQAAAKRTRLVTPWEEA